jgi:hypothetical protein
MCSLLNQICSCGSSCIIGLGLSAMQMGQIGAGILEAVLSSTGFGYEVIEMASFSRAR